MLRRPPKKNLDAVNSMRIEITKALRKEYPNNSVTGIYDGVLARELCPELVLSGSLTKRENFLETIKKVGYLYRQYRTARLNRVENGRIRCRFPCNHKRKASLRGDGRL